MQSGIADAVVSAPPQDRPPLRPAVSLGVIAVLAAIILVLVPRPAAVTVQGWRMVAIFFSTVLALMLRPIA